MIFWRKRHVDQWKRFLSEFVDGKISDEDFQQKFFVLFRENSDRVGKKNEELLDNFFWIMEDYTSIEELREPGDINELELKEIVKDMLSKMN